MWIQYAIVTLIVLAALLFALWRLPGNTTRRRYTALLRRAGGGHGALNALARSLETQIARSEAASGCASCSSAEQGKHPPGSR